MNKKPYLLLLLVNVFSICMEKNQPPTALEAQKLQERQKVLLKKANAGKVKAMTDLASSYISNPEPNYTEAIKWYTKAAELGNLLAVEELALIYLLGFGLPQNAPDYVKAKPLLLKAATLGNSVAAMENLGKLYMQGCGLPEPDYITAKEWYLKAANKGNIDAMVQLATLYQEGLGSDKPDYSQALKWLTKAAQAGKVTAMDRLATLYFTGLGLEKPDYGKAYEWLTKAAQRQDPQAMVHLAILYLKGIGLPQPDYEKAFKLLTQAAYRGQPEAWANLGIMYLEGKGVNRDYDKAFEFFSKAASLNVSSAMHQLGYMYQAGLIGNKPDDRLALQWYTKARQLRNIDGTISLANMYALGLGMEQPNFAVAEKLLEDLKKFLKSDLHQTPDHAEKIALIEKELQKIRQMREEETEKQQLLQDVD